MQTDEEAAGSSSAVAAPVSQPPHFYIFKFQEFEAQFPSLKRVHASRLSTFYSQVIPVKSTATPLHRCNSMNSLKMLSSHIDNPLVLYLSSCQIFDILSFNKSCFSSNIKQFFTCV